MKEKFKRSFDEIVRIVDATERFFSQESIPAGLRTATDLCIEELFVNMVKYNTETRSDIVLQMSAIPGGLEVSLADFGVDRFDPTVPREIDIDAPLSAREPGGLGVYLVLKMVDAIHYEYHDRQSKITFRIKEAGLDV